MAIFRPNMQKNQSKKFIEGEGDKWFERHKNATNIFYETETIKNTLKHFKEDIGCALEIGCGNGAKLNDICESLNARGYGIDPSKEAIEDGNRSHSKLKLCTGIASNLPYDDNTFDLVYFGFCLYLVDRREIFRALSEADRVLKNGGFLAILDFDPKIRHKRPYHHAPGLFSYKTSYSDFFTAGGHYYLVAKQSFSHENMFFTANSDERISSSILYKELDAY